MGLEKGSTLRAKCGQAKGTTRTYSDGCASSFRARNEGIGREVTVVTVSDPQQGSLQQKRMISSNKAIVNMES